MADDWEATKRAAQTPFTEQQNSYLEHIQSFLDKKYVVHADERQKAMGLGYITAERQDLAKEIAHFIQGVQNELLEAQSKTWDQENEQLKSVNAEFSSNRDNERNDTAVTVQAARAALSWIEEGKKEHSHRLQQIRDAIDALENIIPQKSALQAENEQLKSVNAELVEMLDQVVERGLIYWEPQTTRGSVARTEMIEKASTLITKAQQVHQPERQPSVPEPERDRDLEPDL